MDALTKQSIEEVKTRSRPYAAGGNRHRGARARVLAAWQVIAATAGWSSSTNVSRATSCAYDSSRRSSRWARSSSAGSAAVSSTRASRRLADRHPHRPDPRRQPPGDRGTMEREPPSARCSAAPPACSPHTADRALSGNRNSQLVLNKRLDTSGTALATPGELLIRHQPPQVDVAVAAARRHPSSPLLGA